MISRYGVMGVTLMTVLTEALLFVCMATGVLLYAKKK
jgi:hypothetical protein